VHFFFFLPFTLTIRHLRGTLTFLVTVRFATPTELFTPPPYGSLAFQTRLPVSALAAKIQPSDVATYMQPSATTGVPVMSPPPPFLTVEKVHAGVSSGASAAPIVFSWDCVRVFL
jgi:hypothetical protein